MKSVTASSLILSIAKSPVLSSLLILMVMFAGLMSGSMALVVVSGVLAYGRPILYCILYGEKDDDEKSTVIESNRHSLSDRRVPGHTVAFDLR